MASKKLKKSDLSELPWERQKGESINQYKQFCCYRNIPFELRSRDIAYRIHKHKLSGFESDKLQGKTDSATGSFCKTMQDKLWVYRAGRYTEYLEKLERNQLERERILSKRHRINAYNGALGVSMKGLNQLSRRMDDKDKPLELAPAEIARLMKVSGDGLRQEYEPNKFEIEHSGEVATGTVTRYEIPDNGRKRKKKNDE